MAAEDWVPLIVGTVGSHAYGLAGPESDVDTLAVAAAPTVAFHGLHPPTGRQATRVTTGPDSTVHEAGKFLALCLSCNPTVNELLWLPGDCYRELHPMGLELVGLRRRLLSARGVRDAYLGYATSQFARLRHREGDSFSSDTRKRTEKHARHLLRLVDCGVTLYATGEMSVRVADPQRYRDFGRLVAADPAEGLLLAEDTIATARETMEAQPSALPTTPDTAVAEEWLLAVRAHFFTAARGRS